MPCLCLFFFKQKTAYEMRISDWSSDVCSSDLDLGLIYRDRLFWRLAPISMACMASSMAIQGLWIGPWLRDVTGLDRAGLAGYLLANAASMTLGFLSGGLAADLLGRIGTGLVKVMSGGVLLFMVSTTATRSET